MASAVPVILCKNKAPALLKVVAVNKAVGFMLTVSAEAVDVTLP